MRNISAQLIKMRFLTIIFVINLGSLELAARPTISFVDNSWNTKVGDDYEFAQTWGAAGFIKFQLKTGGEAVICLSSSTTCSEPSRSVMVTLGCNNNQMVEIATSKDSKTFTSENLLDGSVYVNFTLIWQEGLIVLWKDSTTSQKTRYINKAIGTLRATNPIDVKYFGFKSKTENGVWIISGQSEPCEKDTEVCSTKKIEEYHTVPKTRFLYVPFDGKEGRLRFEVRAPEEATFMLTSTDFYGGPEHTEIQGVIGKQGNEKSILLFREKRRREVDTHQLLTAHEYVGFWLLWSQGYVSLWTDDQDEALATKFVLQEFEIHYLGLMTYTSNGDWKIHICETASSVLTTTSAPPALHLTDPPKTDNNDICNGMFKCSSMSKCVNSRDVCDGYDHCGDGSDEVGCDKCNGKFKCKRRSTCVSQRKVCDGYVDCGDGSDEVGCDECKGEAFKCNSTTRCIQNNKVCDGYDNCGDDSDEVRCDECKGEAFKCNSTSKCVSDFLKCNGEDDCGDGSDEDGCYICNGMFKCSSMSKCVHLRDVCDGYDDCDDGEDEVGCDECKGGAFKCNSTPKCILRRYVCDGHGNCGDGSDEVGCDERKEGEFKCINTSDSIPQSYVCDGDNDCGDSSDEVGCDECKGEAFKCNSTSKCVPDHLKCNGEDDCGDGSDEDGC